MCFSNLCILCHLSFQLLFLAFAQCARLSDSPHLIHSLCFLSLSSSWSLLIKLFCQIITRNVSFSLSQLLSLGLTKAADTTSHYGDIWDQTKVVCKRLAALKQRFTPLARATEARGFFIFY